MTTRRRTTNRSPRPREVNTYLITLSTGATVKCAGEAYNVNATRLIVRDQFGNVTQSWANGTWLDIAIVNAADPTVTPANTAYQPLISPSVAGRPGTNADGSINWTGTGPVTG